jgi:transcription termination factor NusB
VSLDEAIEIGKRYSAGEASAFINGVLDQIARVKGEPS